MQRRRNVVSMLTEALSRNRAIRDWRRWRRPSSREARRPLTRVRIRRCLWASGFPAWSAAIVWRAWDGCPSVASGTILATRRVIVAPSRLRRSDARTPLWRPRPPVQAIRRFPSLSRMSSLPLTLLRRATKRMHVSDAPPRPLRSRPTPLRPATSTPGRRLP